MKFTLLFATVLGLFSSSASAQTVPIQPVEVRRQAFSATAKCIKRVTSEPEFRKGTCGTSGCMNAYLSCSASAEAIVSKHAQNSVAIANDLHTTCSEPLQTLLAVASNDLPLASELNIGEPIDTALSISTVRRLAAYELIYLTVIDKSCYAPGQSPAPKQ